MGEKTQKPLKLVSFNICLGKYFEQVLQFLKQENADIICLQEVSRHGMDFGPSDRDIYVEIGEALHMKGAYRHMFWADHGEGRFDFGLAIYSRLPILQTTYFCYERQPTENVLDVSRSGNDRYNIPRVLMGGQIQIGEKRVWVMNTHHTLTPNGGVTEHQLESTKNVKQFLTGYDSFILCGDMNTPYPNENYWLLAEDLRDVSLPEEATLHPQLHAIGSKGYHVDYIFFKGKFIRHDTSRIPQVDASDHLPVVVSFFLDQ